MAESELGDIAQVREAPHDLRATIDYCHRLRQLLDN
jgi:hypothetical protein